MTLYKSAANEIMEALAEKLDLEKEAKRRTMELAEFTRMVNELARNKNCAKLKGYKDRYAKVVPMAPMDAWKALLNAIRTAGCN